MRRILAATSLFVMIAACGQPDAILTPTAVTTAPAAFPPEAGNPPAFTIAIEYAIPGLGAAYAPTGITYAKPQPIFGMWGLIEPEPGMYDWGPLDDLVVEYQAAGFHGIQLLITAESPWASTDSPSLLDPGNTFPKEEFIDEYVGFVTRFVERYDGDGLDDAPGLLYPVHHYGIEREFTGYWPSNADDYIRLLRLAYPAIHRADPQAEVLIVAILMVDVFDGDPDEAELELRLATPQKGIRKSVPEIQAVLAACDAYDILDFHSLGDYTEIPPTAAWLRGQLQDNGCQEIPLWIGDAFSMSALVGYNGRPAWPATAENLAQVIDTLELVADPAADGHEGAQSWLYALMAGGLVKKVVVSAGEGILGINVGNLEDWRTNIPPVDILGVPLVGTSMFMGMMDTRVTGQPSGVGLPGYRAPGETRPAFQAVKLVNDKISGFTAVEKLDLGTGIWAYRFTTPTGPAWVLWYDDGVLYFPGEAPAQTPLSLPFESQAALLTWTPVLSGGENPETQLLQPVDGYLQFMVDPRPVFIEAVP